MIPAPTPEQEQASSRTDDELSAARSASRQAGAADRARRSAPGRNRSRDTPAVDWAPSRDVAVDLPLDGDLHGDIRRDPARSEKYVYTDGERLRWCTEPPATWP